MTVGARLRRSVPKTGELLRFIRVLKRAVLTVNDYLQSRLIVHDEFWRENRKTSTSELLFYSFRDNGDGSCFYSMQNGTRS